MLPEILGIPGDEEERRFDGQWRRQFHPARVRYES